MSGQDGPSDKWRIAHCYKEGSNDKSCCPSCCADYDAPFCNGRVALVRETAAKCDACVDDVLSQQRAFGSAPLGTPEKAPTGGELTKQQAEQADKTFAALVEVSRQHESDPLSRLTPEQFARVRSITMSIVDPFNMTDAEKLRFAAVEIDLAHPGDTEPEMQLELLRIADRIERMPCETYHDTQWTKGGTSA